MQTIIAAKLMLIDISQYLPLLISKVESICEENGLRNDSIVMRMTGCPNGCARPYVAEVAFVGGGVPVLADKPVARKNDEVAQLLGSKCPKLRRLDHWARGTHRIVVLARGGEDDKVRWVVMRTRGEEDGCVATKGKPPRAGRGKC